MTISVDIADRLFDYTDEEKAADAVAEYQASSGMDDDAILALWANDTDPRREVLENLIFAAVDTNGSAKRAQETIPCGIDLLISEDENAQ